MIIRIFDFYEQHPNTTQMNRDGIAEYLIKQHQIEAKINDALVDKKILVNHKHIIKNI